MQIELNKRIFKLNCRITLGRLEVSCLYGCTKILRIVLKLSGEALAGSLGYGIDPDVVNTIARQIKEVVEHRVQISVVVGGGNIWRGVEAKEWTGNS